MNKLFEKKAVIGMVHVFPLPGNASYKGDNKDIEERALADAHALIDCGVDAIMVENFYDWPQYSTAIPFEAYAVMQDIVTKIRSFCTLPLGVNIEMNAYEQEWMMAYATGADFTRIEAFVDNRAGSFGYIEACSTQLMNLMKKFPAKTMIFADVHTQETYGNPNIPIAEAAGNAKNHDAAAVVVTENDNNQKITVDDIKKVREKVGPDFPIIVGSGVKTSNILDYLSVADGVIVGRGFKTDDRVDPVKVREFLAIVRGKYSK